MNIETLSKSAIAVIDQYSHLEIGSAVSSVPYFNNKTIGARITLRAYIGKGSPKDILDEIQALVVKNHISPDSLTDESLKKLLIDNNIGIDCSGFAYHVLNAQSEALHKGSLKKHLSFIKCSGIIGKIRCSLRPAENCDVATLANDKNSRVIGLNEIKPGDIITMTNQIEKKTDAQGLFRATPSVQSDTQNQTNYERDHILVIHQVEYNNAIPTKVHYSHAVTYPEDGLSGGGIRQGKIEITGIEKNILTAVWIENGKTGFGNRLFSRAQKSDTKVRRLKWW